MMLRNCLVRGVRFRVVLRPPIEAWVDVGLCKQQQISRRREALQHLEDAVAQLRCGGFAL